MFSRCGALALGTLLSCVSLAVAAGPSPAAGEGLIVLRGGEVLFGRISRQSGKFVVADNKGGEIRLPESAVEMHVGSLDEAYRRKLSAIDPGDAGQQLQLADWCLRQSLVSQAADCLLEATVIQPNHPGIRRIENRLDLATSQFTATQQSAAGVSKSTIGVSQVPTSVPGHHTDGTQAALPPKQGQDVRGTGDRPIVEDDSLRRAIENLPAGATERFANTVQPLLLSRCAGCHRVGSQSKLQLLRPAKGRAVPRGYTEHNLQATLAFVDRDRPGESPLLETPRRAHGGAAPLIHNTGQLPWSQLTGWLDSLSARRPVPVASIKRPNVNLPQRPGGDGRPFPAQTSPIERDDQRQNADRPQPLPDGYVPRDEFDPAIFNRRFRKAPDS